LAKIAVFLVPYFANSTLLPSINASNTKALSHQKEGHPITSPLPYIHIGHFKNAGAYF